MEEENKVLDEQNGENLQNQEVVEPAKEAKVEETKTEETEEKVEETKVEETKTEEKIEKTEAKEEVTSDNKKEATKEDKKEGGDNKKRVTRDRPNQSRQPNSFKTQNKKEKEYEERIVKVNRISKTVKGGKRMRFSALVVIGDSNGKYGYGMGKSIETTEAIKKAIVTAQKKVMKVEIVSGGTIAHEIVGKFGATQVYLKPAPEGTGLVAGGAVRAILELAGIKNVYSKIYGSRTQMNVVKATVAGLNGLKSYSKVKQIRYNK